MKKTTAAKSSKKFTGRRALLNETPVTEKAKLVAAVLALDPKANVTEDDSRATLRQALADAKANAEAKQITPTETLSPADAALPTVIEAKAEPIAEIIIAPHEALSIAAMIPAPAPFVCTAPQVVDVVTTESKVVEIVEVETEGGKAKRYVSKTAPDSKYHLRERSSAVKPVKIVHNYCAENPDADRKTVIAYCIIQGVNKHTAATQFSLWHARRKQAAMIADLQAKLAAATGESVEDETEE